MQNKRGTTSTIIFHLLHGNVAFSSYLYSIPIAFLFKQVNRFKTYKRQLKWNKLINTTQKLENISDNIIYKSHLCEKEKTSKEWNIIKRVYYTKRGFCNWHMFY